MFYDSHEIETGKVGTLMNPGIMIIALIGGLAGAFSTLYLLLSFPAVIIWKIYRRIRHSIPMTK